MSKDTIQNVIGLTEKEAIVCLNKFGIKNIRVMERNGELFAGIANYDLSRINLYISKDKVYKVERG